MNAVGLLTTKRKTITRVLLLWLLLGGQLLCTSHAGFGVELAKSSAQAPNPCHGGTDTTQPQVDTGCCENAASFCCGDGKYGSADTADSKFGHVGAVPSSPHTFPNLLYPPADFPRWAEQIVLRRSDPPIHLRNCTFLD